MCVANAFSLTAWRVNSGLVGSMKFIECAHRKSNLRLMRSIDGRPFRLQWNSLQLLATCKWQLAIFAQRHSLHASPILNAGRRTQDRRLDLCCCSSKCLDSETTERSICQRSLAKDYRLITRTKARKLYSFYSQEARLRKEKFQCIAGPKIVVHSNSRRFTIKCN